MGCSRSLVVSGWSLVAMVSEYFFITHGFGRGIFLFSVRFWRRHLVPSAEADSRFSYFSPALTCRAIFYRRFRDWGV